MVRVVGSKAGGRLGGRPHKVSRERYPQMMRQLKNYRASLTSSVKAGEESVSGSRWWLQQLINHRSAIQLDPDIAPATRAAVTDALDELVTRLQGSEPKAKVMTLVSEVARQVERLIAELAHLDASREGAAE